MMSRVFSPPSSMVSTLTYSPRREVTRASRGHVRAEMVRSNKLLSGSSSSTSLCSCGRKHFLESTSPTTTMLPLLSFNHQRPDWYKELFAWFLNTWMGSYEAEVSLYGLDSSLLDTFLEISCFMFVLYGKIADYKKRLFNNLTGKAEKVLEIGVGTCPNLKYYAKNENLCVFGMDPNQKMEKYANESAREAGLKPENFSFMQGVGEAIPLDDAYVDAVVTTLVLCSVSDVKQTLNG
ncbi:unnamed protein product [Cochlearia groenlandica]